MPIKIGQIKRNILFLLVVAAFTSATHAQLRKDWCGTDDIRERQFAEKPEMRAIFREEIMEASRTPRSGTRMVYTIPVVVHVIHDNGIGNISDAQVQSALDVLNEDFARLNADTISTRNSISAPFRAVAGGIDLTFKLAK